MEILKYLIVISLSSFVVAKNLKSLSCSSSFPDVCGPNANCVEGDLFRNLHELSYCECNSYAFGEPPNCTSKCKEKCTTDEYCDTFENKCMKKCVDHENCGIDEYCRYYEGDCKKGCRDHKSCKDNELCDFHEKVCKTGCRGDEFCNSDEYCDFFKNTCIKGCRDDNSCNENEYCDTFDDRLCKLGCREWPGNCEKGEFCNSDNHVCEKGCEHDIHCESNQICNLSDKMCYSYCLESPCGSNSICTIVDSNHYCSCKVGYSPVKGVGCKRIRGTDPTFIYEETPDCQKYCGHKSLCVMENYKIVCYCPESNGYNPFIDCSFTPSTGVTPSITSEK